MYPNYLVKKINSFQDLLMIMDQDYKTEIAFSSDDFNLTYGQLVKIILETSKVIESINQHMVRLETDDMMHYAILYLASVVSGKIAVLDNHELNIEEDITSISDHHIKFVHTDDFLSHPSLPIIDNRRVCTIIKSSGTSSTPKGIMLSQKNICTDVVYSLEKYSMRRGDRFINVLPLDHVFGLIGDLLCPLLSGATVFFLKNKKTLFSDMRRIRPTMINVPPIIAEMMLKLIENGGRSDDVTGGNLRKVLCGGAGLRATVAQELRSHGIFAYGCYGLSETAACVSINRDDYYKDGSAGVPIDCNIVEIADDGEILVAGNNVMIGYYKDEEETKRVIREGVFHTGDIGYLDADGFLFVTGRKSNMIVFDDGTKCYPEVLENDIISNTAADEAFVFQQENKGRTVLGVKIFVSDSNCQKAIFQYIKRFIKYRFDIIDFVSEPIPKNETGKIRRV